MVAYIFLNLFIAIVVDTYLAMSDAFNLPVKQCDVDMFVELWSNYDKKATGFISWRDFDSLLIDLEQSDTEFFQHIPDHITDDEKRKKYITSLELPAYNKLSDYSFHDVLVLMCRENCMYALYPEAKKKNIEKKLQQLAFEHN
jgi:hypothetical protein